MTGSSTYTWIRIKEALLGGQSVPRPGAFVVVQRVEECRLVVLDDVGEKIFLLIGLNGCLTRVAYRSKHQDMPDV